jgi:hypothetical protein
MIEIDATDNPFILSSYTIKAPIFIISTRDIIAENVFIVRNLGALEGNVTYSNNFPYSIVGDGAPLT